MQAEFSVSNPARVVVEPMHREEESVSLEDEAKTRIRASNAPKPKIDPFAGMAENIVANAEFFPEYRSVVERLRIPSQVIQASAYGTPAFRVGQGWLAYIQFHDPLAPRDEPLGMTIGILTNGAAVAIYGGDAGISERGIISFTTPTREQWIDAIQEVLQTAETHK